MPAVLQPGSAHTPTFRAFIIWPHRDVAPKQRERIGIHDGLVRLCAGIEAVDDIVADLDQALRRKSDR